MDLETLRHETRPEILDCLNIYLEIDGDECSLPVERLVDALHAERAEVARLTREVEARDRLAPQMAQRATVNDLIAINDDPPSYEELERRLSDTYDQACAQYQRAEELEAAAGDLIGRLRSDYPCSDETLQSMLRLRRLISPALTAQSAGTAQTDG